MRSAGLCLDQAACGQAVLGDGNRQRSRPKQFLKSTNNRTHGSVVRVRWNSRKASLDRNVERASVRPNRARGNRDTGNSTTRETVRAESAAGTVDQSALTLPDGGVREKAVVITEHKTSTGLCSKLALIVPQDGPDNTVWQGGEPQPEVEAAESTILFAWIPHQRYWSPETSNT